MKIMKIKIRYAAALLLLLNSCSKEFIKDSGIIREQDFTYPATFTSLDNNGRFDVKLIPSATQKVKIKADQAVFNEIVSEVQNGRLSLHYKNSRRDYRHSQVSITVYTTPISEIALAGSGTISSDDTLRGGLQLYTNLSGSGSINLKTAYPSIFTNVSGSGIIKLEGIATTAVHTMSGSGKIQTYGLETAEAQAIISGSGSIQVKAVNKLKATISGSGNIYYKGNPLLTATRSGTGSIIHQ